MKPKILVMSGFCPYANEVMVDFEKFENSGIFLITGETGAGKTTIFDGISFALFGEVSGENREANSLRSDFAPSTTETFVTLSFEHNGKEYKINRIPKYNRPLKRGDASKMTVQNADAQLYLPNGDLVTGYKDVTDAVIDILGINHKQFKQIAMIAQGEFLKLLFADSKQRGEILRRVFQTEIYLDIQNELKQKALTLKKKLDEINSSISQYSNDVICDENSEHYEEVIALKQNLYSLDELMKTLEQIEKEQKILVNNYVEKISKYDENISEQVKKRTQGETINALIDSLEKEKAKESSLQLKQAEIINLKSALEFSKNSMYHIKPHYDNYISINNQCKRLSTAIENAEKSLNNYREDASLSASKLEILCGKENEISATIIYVANLKENMQKYSELQNTINQELSVQKSLEDLGEQEKNLSENMRGLLDEKQKIQSRIDKNGNLLVRKLEIETSVKEINLKLDKLDRIKGLCKKNMANREVLAKKQAEFLILSEIYNEMKIDFDKMQNCFYKQQAGILAQSLSEGEACPVCGSKSHPQKAVLSQDEITEQGLHEQKIKLEEEQESVQAQSEACGEILALVTQNQTLIHNLQNELGLQFDENIDDVVMDFELKLGASKNQFEVELSKTKKGIEQNEKDTKRLIELSEEVQNKSEKLENYKNKIREENIVMAQILSEKKNISKNLEFDDEEKAKKTLLEKENLISSHKKLMDKTKSEHDDILKQINEITAVKTDNKIKTTALNMELEAVEKILKQAYLDNGIENTKEFLDRLLNPEQVGEYEKIISDHNNESQRIKATIAQLTVQINGETKVNLDEIDKMRDELKIERESIVEMSQDVQQNIKSNQDIVKKLQKKKKMRDSVEGDYSQIKMLSDTANGDIRGKQRLAFEQYVQAVYFNMILNEANKRLLKMTQNRYYLSRREQASNLKSMSGLEIDVYDNWTGKIRGVKSLSGGEAFKASLSIALGLSDVVQNFSGGIQLDTIFIDEGFGSLDAQSLQMAMEILSELTYGNRLVGIISHVEELKEKIDKKIIITQDRLGSKISIEI